MQWVHPFEADALVRELSFGILQLTSGDDGVFLKSTSTGAARRLLPYQLTTDGLVEIVIKFLIELYPNGSGEWSRRINEAFRQSSGMEPGAFFPLGRLDHSDWGSENDIGKTGPPN